jgi:glucose/mannose-6-phosphate isomerase
MGGSAIGGEMAAFAVADRAPLPIISNRAYDLPAFAAGVRTLVIGSSHSGNTEETLTAFGLAHERGCKLLAITTGGKLKALAEEAGIPAWTYSYDSQPRAAMGFGLAMVLGLLNRLGFAPGLEAQVNEAVNLMRAGVEKLGAEIPASDNSAKALTGRLNGHMPVTFGAGIMEPVARRWMTQFNENSKTWAQALALPELNHNAVVGIDNPAGLAKQFAVVMLRSAHDSERVATRYEVTEEILKDRAGIAVETVWGSGESRLAQMLSMVQLGDYVSFYTAMAYGADPTPIEAINLLKSKLGAFGG